MVSSRFFFFSIVERWWKVAVFVTTDTSFFLFKHTKWWHQFRFQSKNVIETFFYRVPKNAEKMSDDKRSAIERGISKVSDNFMLERWEVKFHSYVFEHDFCHGIQFTFPSPCRAKLKCHSSVAVSIPACMQCFYMVLLFFIANWFTPMGAI